MRVLAHGANGQLIGDSVIDAKADSAGREVITLWLSVAVHIDKVTESGHPHTPTIFRSRAEEPVPQRLWRIFRPRRPCPPDEPWRR